MKQKGSILVLTAMAVLVLSIMVTGLVTVGATELDTTQNYFLSRHSYYTAMRGVEEIRIQIHSADSPSEIPNMQANKKITNQLVHFVVPGKKDMSYPNLNMVETYITGSLRDWHDTSDTFYNITEFQGFDAPVTKGRNLDRKQFKVEMKVWRVPITAEAATGVKRDADGVVQNAARAAYTELIAGVTYLLVVGYE